MTAPVQPTPFQRHALLGALCAAVLLTLTACGGGDDDGPVPSPAPDPIPPQSTPASDCAMTTRLVRGSSVLQFTAGEFKGVEHVEDILNEPVTLDGRQLLRDTTQWVREYSAPAGNVGLKRLEVEQRYFNYLDAAGLSHSEVANARSYQWSDRPEPFYTSATRYDPPAVNRLLTLLPGQTGDVPLQGTTQTTEDGKTTTETLKDVNHIIYHGQEEVSVPAGRFMTCKFTYRWDSGGARTFWTMKGGAGPAGLGVKQIIERPDQAPEIQELVSYTGYR